MRQVKTINNNWYFSKTAKGVEKATLKEFKEEAQALLTYPGGLVFRGCSDWVEINLPHTWNGRDGQDGGNDDGNREDQKVLMNTALGQIAHSGTSFLKVNCIIAQKRVKINSKNQA